MTQVFKVGWVISVDELWCVVFKALCKFGVWPAGEDDADPRRQGLNVVNQKINNFVFPVLGGLIQSVDNDGEALPVNQPSLACAREGLGDEYVPQTAGVLALHERGVLDAWHSEQTRPVIGQASRHLVGQTQHQLCRVVCGLAAAFAQVNAKHTALGGVGEKAGDGGFTHAGATLNAKDFAA